MTRDDLILAWFHLALSNVLTVTLRDSQGLSNHAAVQPSRLEKERYEGTHAVVPADS